MPFSQHRLQQYIALYGYVPVELPLVEPASLFLTKAGDQIIERLFTFEHHGRQLALRPEFTASAVNRYLNEKRENSVVRWQFNGAIFEDIPGSGSGNYQRLSMGAELIGMAGSFADAELMAMAALGLEEQGLTGCRLIIGHVGLTRHLLQTFQLDDRTLRFLLNHRTLQREAVLDKLRQYLSYTDGESVNESETLTEQTLSVMLGNRAMGSRPRDDIARRLLEKQRQSTSFDQIKQAVDFLERWNAICSSPEEAFREIEAIVGGTGSVIFNEWKSAVEMLKLYGIASDQICIQPDLARSWDYYTGIVFELQSESGVSLAGGGRYDELTQLIGGRTATPAVGFAYDIDTIQAHLSKDAPSEGIHLTESGNASVVWAQRLRENGVQVSILPESGTIKVIDENTVEVNDKRFTPEEISQLIQEALKR